MAHTAKTTATMQVIPANKLRVFTDSTFLRTKFMVPSKTLLRVDDLLGSGGGTILKERTLRSDHKTLDFMFAFSGLGERTDSTILMFPNERIIFYF
jgi:hypothetical protein